MYELLFGYLPILFNYEGAVKQLISCVIRLKSEKIRIFALTYALRRRRRVLLQPSTGQFFIMNWIILITAGCFETGFAFCLGKMKGLSGTPWCLWGIGFLICLTLRPF